MATIDQGNRMDNIWLDVIRPVALLTLVVTALAIATWNAVKAKSFRWGWRVSAVPLWAGLVSFVLFTALPSTVDRDGVVHEPFAFLGIAWFLFLFGALAVLVLGLSRFVRQFRR